MSKSIFEILNNFRNNSSTNNMKPSSGIAETEIKYKSEFIVRVSNKPS